MLFMLVFDRQGPSRFWTWEYLAYTIFLVKCINFCHGTVNMKVVYPNESMWLHLFCLVCDYTSSVLYVITPLLSCMWLRVFCLVCGYASSVLYVVTRLLSCMWLRVFCLVCDYASSVLYVITPLLSCMQNYIDYVFQYISNKMQLYTVYLYLETALHVLGGTSTHHQERIQLYLQHLVLVTPLPLPAAIVEKLEEFQLLHDGGR